MKMSHKDLIAKCRAFGIKKPTKEQFNGNKNLHFPIIDVYLVKEKELHSYRIQEGR